MFKINRLNLGYWIKRIAGRATCVLGRNTRLRPSAKIHNIRGNNHYISIGDNSLVAGELLVFPNGGKISIGHWCYVGENALIWSSGNIEIGNRVLISHNVNIFDSLTHPIDAKLRHAQFREILLQGHPSDIDLGECPVQIEEDAWIGANSIILRGVTIGKAAVVGAGSVVTQDVPPFTVVAGNPARIIRKLDEEPATSDES